MMPKKILYINACVRKNSRTKRLADCLVSRLEGETEEVRLEDICFGISDERFITGRDRLLAAGVYDHPMFGLARSFAAADVIVIAAPFWDLSFPAALKQYFEQVNAIGITFRYTETGEPQGLCKAEKLYYVTTAGGPIYSDAFGYGYVKALAQTFYGIPETEMISAENLDMIGADVEAILRETIDKQIRRE
jgi:FMN-dependent NADH-azoreductase